MNLGKSFFSLPTSFAVSTLSIMHVIKRFTDTAKANMSPSTSEKEDLSHLLQKVPEALKQVPGLERNTRKNWSQEVGNAVYPIARKDRKRQRRFEFEMKRLLATLRGMEHLQSIGDASVSSTLVYVLLDSRQS